MLRCAQMPTTRRFILTDQTKLPSLSLRIHILVFLLQDPIPLLVRGTNFRRRPSL